MHTLRQPIERIAAAPGVIYAHGLLHVAPPNCYIFCTVYLSCCCVAHAITSKRSNEKGAYSLCGVCALLTVTQYLFVMPDMLNIRRPFDDYCFCAGRDVDYHLLPGTAYPVKDFWQPCREAADNLCCQAVSIVADSLREHSTMQMIVQWHIPNFPTPLTGK